jgi:hypothetical protein
MKRPTLNMKVNLMGEFDLSSLYFILLLFLDEVYAQNFIFNENSI